MEKQIKQKGVAHFSGLNIGANKTITVKFKIPFDEILTSINLLKGLNTDITVQAKTGINKPVNLGIFTIGAISFDRDGNATIPFKSMVDNVNVENIVSIIDADEDYVQLRFLAVLELPDNEEEEEENGEWGEEE